MKALTLKQDRLTNILPMIDAPLFIGMLLVILKPNQLATT